MTVARLYRMVAAEGREQALRDARKPGSFVFIEKWTSIEAHKAAGSALPKDTLGPVMAALANPPEGAYLDYLIGT